MAELEYTTDNGLTYDFKQMEEQIEAKKKFLEDRQQAIYAN